MDTRLGGAQGDPQEIITDLQRQLVEARAERDAARTARDEALERQTATAEVLGVINSSPGDLTPVFEALLEKALRLCGGAYGSLLRYDGEFFHVTAAVHAEGSVAEQHRRRPPFRPEPGYLLYPVLQGEEVVVIDDVQNRVDHRINSEFRAIVDAGGYRSILYVALRKERALLGVIAIWRLEVRLFSDKEIALLQNFAAQAVIAMDNARLITETQEALEQQTATAEVLQVINSSPGDLAPVFDAMLEKAMRLCGASHAHLFMFDGEKVHPAAVRGDRRFADWLWEHGVVPVMAGSSVHRMLHGESFVQMLDATEVEAYRVSDWFREMIDRSRGRTTLNVPLRKNDALLGTLHLYRPEVQAFSEKQIALVQNFAAQAVIAMENARLITETRQARDDAETALHNLEAAQSSLVQAQKMAALGQLTAGIAHEIKNPLNFVNNFASLSTELLGELKEAIVEDRRDEIDETIELLTGNLGKIAEHGQRADNIVKSMLDHSRGVSGERREVDLNALIDEALNLAYHGARAQDASFNVTLERDYAQDLKTIELIPQEMTRVFLNLIGNGFYATDRRAKASKDGYRPTLSVSTVEADRAIEVRVRDNGTGIPSDVVDKLFQPFFTTKPTGEGTGLGLSISYDIVTQQHGGTIEVASEEGAYTEFTIRLPRR